MTLAQDHWARLGRAPSYRYLASVRGVNVSACFRAVRSLQTRGWMTPELRVTKAGRQACDDAALAERARVMARMQHGRSAG